jgi:hypothetical protein
MMPQRHYCTLFDCNYLIKGLAMLRSICEHSPGASVWVLCLDDHARSLLDRLAIPGVHTMALAEVETPDVLEAKKTRSIAEYCWTLSSVLMWHVMQSRPEIDLLTYLDADLLFFSPVERLFEEMGSGSIAVIEHRYTPRLRHLEVYGRFNVQWVSFRRDEQGLDCLRTWRDQCVEWCYAVLSDGKLGDQKYLDAWPSRYSGFRNLQHVGAGLAPWNYPNYRIADREGRLYVDDRPLIFYHFHQFQILENGAYDYCSSNYTKDGEPPEAVYGRYRAATSISLAELQQLEPGFALGIKGASSVTLRRIAQRYLPAGLKNVLHRIGVHAK